MEEASNSSKSSAVHLCSILMAVEEEYGEGLEKFGEEEERLEKNIKTPEVRQNLPAWDHRYLHNNYSKMGWQCSATMP